jgi:hypothetical protein
LRGDERVHTKRVAPKESQVAGRQHVERLIRVHGEDASNPAHRLSYRHGCAWGLRITQPTTPFLGEGGWDRRVSVRGQQSPLEHLKETHTAPGLFPSHGHSTLSSYGC